MAPPDISQGNEVGDGLVLVEEQAGLKLNLVYATEINFVKQKETEVN